MSTTSWRGPRAHDHAPAYRRDPPISRLSGAKGMGMAAFLPSSSLVIVRSSLKLDEVCVSPAAPPSPFCWSFVRCGMAFAYRAKRLAQTRRVLGLQQGAKFQLALTEAKHARRQGSCVEACASIVAVLRPTVICEQAGSLGLANWLFCAFPIYSHTASRLAAASLEIIRRQDWFRRCDLSVCSHLGTLES